MDQGVERSITTVRIMFTVYLVYKAYLLYRKVRGRRCWVRDVNLSRDETGFFEFGMKQIKSQDEEHFFIVTRMSVEKFEMLLSLLKYRLKCYSRREPIQPETRLALTLMYLAHGCSPQVLAWSFKMGVSAIRKIIVETCDAIWKELHEIYVAVPSKCEWKKIADKFFNTTGMPNCLGAIDGKHGNIVCPKRSGSLYYNYKNNYSIVLLAVCDSHYSFIVPLDVGAVGSQSDGGIFSRSRFGNKILNCRLDVPGEVNLPGTNISFPYYFVGDAAFPLKKNLMRPYPGRMLNAGKNNFNTRLSKTRLRIENAFGILTNRWRVLGNQIHCHPKNVDKVVLPTVVLHNFLMFHKDFVDHEEDDNFIQGEWRQQGIELQSSTVLRSNRATTAAFKLREKLKDYLEVH